MSPDVRASEITNEIRNILIQHFGVKSFTPSVVEGRRYIGLEKDGFEYLLQIDAVFTEIED